MNRSIRWGAIFAILLTLVLLIHITVVQAFREDEYAQNPLNARGFLEAQQIPRGNISAGGQVLAESYQDADGNFHRTYPNMPFSFGPVVGYLSPQYGAAGLEQGFNGVLSGTQSATGSRGLPIIEQGDQHGNNIELTVDPNTQATAYEMLFNNGYTGAAVAIRPSTGEVLAMASNPSYDPNSIVDPATSDDAWAALSSDPTQPLVNGATQETLPPGSIFKIITTAAGIQNGYTPNSTLTGASEITLPNTTTTLTNYAGQTCGGQEQVTLSTAFSLSCNTAFVEMGIDVGADAVRSAAEAFGVGETYDLGLPMSPGSLGDLADDASLGQSAIGQRDVTMSALQAAIMGATVANDGKRMEPYLVSRVTRADLTEVSSTEPTQVTQAISPEEAGTLEGLMLAAERSTATYDGNNFASKTGTAEHGEGLPPHVWYVAYDPDNDVAVAVVVENGGGFGESATGGQVAGPVGRAILRAAPQGGGA